MTSSSRYLVALGVSIGTVLFLLIGIGALGIVGDGDSDWLFLAGPVVGLAVSAATRFRPGGMALALGATAATTLVVGLVALALVALGTADGSVLDVLMLTVMYAGLFAGAAWLFSRASR